MGVKRFTCMQGIDGGLANKVRRDFIAFTKPKRQHIASPEACIGEFSDFGSLQLLNGLSHDLYMCQ
jgi:hypothetical protein